MKVSQQARIEMYRAFCKQMLDFGYSLTYIGTQLAYIVRATVKKESE